MCSETTRLRYARVFRACSRPLRRRLIVTLSFLLIYGVSLFAFDGAEGQPETSKWFTPQNILAGCMFIYHFGMLRSQFNDVKTRLERFEGMAPSIFAPKDDTDRRLRRLERVRDDDDR